MKIGDAFPSKYLQSSDIGDIGASVKVVIESCSMGDVQTDGGGRDNKPILYFKNASKGMVLNKTNGFTLSDMLGGETDGWPGHHIEIVVERVEFKGRSVPGLRVRPNAPAAAPAAAVEPEPRKSGEFGSEPEAGDGSIPF